MDSFDFLKAERTTEIELHVERCARVMCELVLFVLVELQPAFSETEAAMPPHPLALPVLEPLHVGAGLDEELHLHLLELARAENEIARGDFIAERFSDLRDPEWDLLAGCLLDIEEIDVRTLRRFGT